MKRAHVWISGNVQGVFFRANTQKQARKRDVSGWVKNLSDGRVEAIFEGEASDVDAMIEWCRSGPSSASVENVEVETEEPTEDFSGFQIRH